MAQENYPVEFLEVGYPVRLRTYGILTDSCGAGRWRGGCGIVREYEILAEEAMLAVRIDSVKNPPWGMAGGKAGGVGRIVVNPGTNHERQLAAAVRRQHPEARRRAAHRDRRRRRLRPSVRPAGRKRARRRAGRLRHRGRSRAREYGVAIDGDTLDPDLTRKLRTKRPAVEAFHRHGYVDSLSS